jgi:hypothetical protein
MLAHRDCREAALGAFDTGPLERASRPLYSAWAACLREASPYWPSALFETSPFRSALGSFFR